MEYIVKKTTECSQEELLQMNGLFNDVFEKNRPLKIMMNQYLNNPLGYSYHSLIIDNDVVVGMNVYVPVFFLVNGEKVLFADSIDSMIRKGYRDIFNYMDMVNAAYAYMKKEGVVFVYGYPNDTAYPVVTKSKLMKELGRMYTYCLPYRIGGIKKKFALFNWASILFCRCWMHFSLLFASEKVCHFEYEKHIESFNETRYRRNDGIYNVQDSFVYKIIEYEGIRTAFLIDVFEKSSRNFCLAVKYIVSHDSDKFDILLYPGYLPFSAVGMLKIPHRFEPKRFVLTGKLLDKSYKSDKLWDVKNWDTNLSNYDLI